MAKKEDIKNGNDITLDDGNITVLQETEFSKEKEAEKAEVAVDTPVSEEITPDVKVDATEVETPQVEEPTVEEPVVTAPSIDPEPAMAAPQIPTPDSPSIDISGISPNLSFPSTPESSINQASDNILSSVPSFGQENNDLYNNTQNSGFEFNANHMQNENNFDYKTDKSHDESGTSEIFNSVYDDVNDTKTVASVVTKEDEINAKKSNLLAYERLYDAGPGKQISILRNFSYEASKWIRAADKSGFVSGEMHDIAKKILREYEGLKEEQQDEFTDDRINSFNNNSNQFNDYSGMSSDGNIVQFPMNNSNNDINKPFAA
jgi:hypothetical protein